MSDLGWVQVDEEAYNAFLPSIETRYVCLDGSDPEWGQLPPDPDFPDDEQPFMWLCDNRQPARKVTERVWPEATPNGFKAMYKLGKYITTDQWKKVDGKIVVGIAGSAQDVADFISYFDPADIGGHWLWNFNGKVDYETEYTGQQNDLLALQQPVPIYDDSDPPQQIGEREPTFEDPNWALGFAGQGLNWFARDHSRDFNEDYG